MAEHEDILAHLGRRDGEALFFCLRNHVRGKAEVIAAAYGLMGDPSGSGAA